MHPYRSQRYIHEQICGYNMTKHYSYQNLRGVSIGKHQKQRLGYCGKQKGNQAGLWNIIVTIRCAPWKKRKKEWAKQWNYYQTISLRPDYSQQTHEKYKRITHKCPPPPTFYKNVSQTRTNTRVTWIKRLSKTSVIYVENISQVL